MTSDAMTDSRKKKIEALRQDRTQLIEQIRQNQATIARSQALLNRIDDLLSKVGVKP